MEKLLYFLKLDVTSYIAYKYHEKTLNRLYTAAKMKTRNSYWDTRYKESLLRHCDASKITNSLSEYYFVEFNKYGNEREKYYLTN